jgi:methylase of polypeptide subunit release factors
MALPWCAWVLTVSSLGHTPITDHAPRCLAVFQPRSRHTKGFEPLQTFEVPLLELAQLLPGTARLEPALASRALCWVDGADQPSVEEACSRAILTHSAYAIVGHGASLAAALVRPTEAGNARLPVDADSLAVLDMRRPNLSRDEAGSVRAEVAHALGAFAELPDAAELEPPRVLLLDLEGGCYFGRRIAHGLAGGPGVPATRSRRRFGGVLGMYALKGRPFTVPTTMETEVAFLMVSLARVGAGSRVFDPCCGSGGLLLCAAALGARRLAGCDIDAESLAGAAINIRAFGFAPAELHAADILRPAGSAASEPEGGEGMYDAIVCDPPYGMKTVVASEDGARAEPGAASVSPTRARLQVSLVIGALLRLARSALSPGGRLVFFLPVRGADLQHTAEALLQLNGLGQAPGLALVAAQRQSFSPTFARWIVVLESRHSDTPTVSV